jgi:hypothetical protein
MGKVRNECEDIPMVLVQNKVDLMPQAVMTKEEANAKVRQSKVFASSMHAIDPHATMCYYQLALPRGYSNCRMVAAWTLFGCHVNAARLGVCSPCHVGLACFNCACFNCAHIKYACIAMRALDRLPHQHISGARLSFHMGAARLTCALQMSTARMTTWTRVAFTV